MKRVSFLLLGIVFAGLFLCGVCVSFSISLWFLLGLLPESSGEYTIGYKNSFLESNTHIKEIQKKYIHQIPNGAHNFNRFVYTRDADSQYIAGIPKLIHQFSVAQELREQSFTVHRIGYVLIAKKGGRTSNNPIVAMGKTFVSVLKDGLPVDVQFIFQRNNTSDSNALYVEESSGSVHGVVHTNSSTFVRSRAQRLPEKSTQPNTTFVTLQKDAISFFPSVFLTPVENKVSELMHFTKTHPKILQSLLSANESVILSIKESSVAIGLLSEDDRAASLIQSWMHAEQGTRHPQKKAFALPDKTIGYEFIPGTSDARFSLTKSAGTTCLQSEEYDERLFLCGKDDILVVSTDELLGNQMVSFLSDSTVLKKGVIQSGVLDVVGLGSDFDRIEYSTTPEVIDIWADLKTKK